MRDIAYLALGSNLGDRAGYLAAAREALARLPQSRVLAVSSADETAPLGSAATGTFLNQMIALETELSPRALLDAIQRIEREAGRTRDVRWGDRTLDIDIVRFAHQVVHEPDLQVPHPELPNRDFWQRELAELDARP
ncbi:MAG TPA: 2-amino-4-hydroxy-6-hydroxymethyldihydropteridine diphosphokinase [Gemmatimonadaceae bacterium]|nr:2-amino-4-hydroxy-6-hydroxymethyldihydropteridine diphosphokinase [Gemmatimonadaceae bacterium]